MKQIFLVTLPEIEDVPRNEVEQYIIEALETWGGSFSPDHPLGPPCPYYDKVKVLYVGSKK